jgi:Flp pilus assembly protein TadD
VAHALQEWVNGTQEAVATAGTPVNQLSASAVDVESIDNLFQEAAVLHEGKFYEKALDVYDQLLLLSPLESSAWYNRGLVLKALGRLEEAVESYCRACQISPAHVKAWYNRGNLLRVLERGEEALLCFDQVIQLDSNHASAWYNRGVVLHKLLWQPEDAISSYDRALAIKPDHAEAWNNRGVALHSIGRLSESLSSYDRAIKFDFVNPKYHWNKGLLKLLQGDYEEGWRLFEFGTKPPLIRSMPYSNLSTPRWLGEQALAGKALLLHHEQGFGDTLQFCRYAKLAEDLGARVILCVPAPLVRLLRTLSPGIAVTVQAPPTHQQHAQIPAHDYQTPLMSLPLAFKTTVETIPGPFPYLTPDPDLVNLWSGRFSQTSRLRVGLVWAGNPRKDQPDANAIDRQRSLSLSALAPILAVPEVDFYSLQKGEEAALQLQQSPWKNQIIDWTDSLQDFADTAALIEHLDLVISVDTSVVHLTGAIGKPVWMLDRFNNCWRWLKNREDSPWYPTLRLFRQEQHGQWRPVIERVAHALQEWVNGKYSEQTNPG